MIHKIALLAPKQEDLQKDVLALQQAFQHRKIETADFETSDDIPLFNPDLVIALSPQDAKLTHYPTYGLINRSKKEYLELPRFLRNLLTYDGYLTYSPVMHEMLQDLMFGARKLDSGITSFDIPINEFSPSAGQQYTAIAEENQPLLFSKIIYHDAEGQRSKFKNMYSFLANQCPYFELIKKVEREDLMWAYRKAGIGLCLNAGDLENQFISQQFLEIVASGALAIAPRSPIIEKYFGENVLYFSPHDNMATVIKTINHHHTWIQANQTQSLTMAQKAQAIFHKHFSFDTYLENLMQLHDDALIKKGFKPDPKENSDQLPSVSYIIRTGGRNRPLLEKALDSLIAQNYPKLRVIFCIYKDFDFMEELIQKYPSLQITVVKDYQSIRSKAICDGMAAVKTDLFGLLDDDDELHPNHVRSLVKTLQYHHQRDWRGPIGMAYSGSIIVDDGKPVHEKSEFHDFKLTNRNEHRVIEHYRFYRPGQMAQHDWFMMSNSWLAKASLIDSELLTDPGIDTCEDLYFELQLAQRTHFAFSAEVTVYHHFHSIGNSTIVDSSRHIPDTQRIALRNFGRSFPGEFQYDTHYNLVGREVGDGPLAKVAYQDPETTPPYQVLYAVNPFYIDRGIRAASLFSATTAEQASSDSSQASLVQLTSAFIDLYPQERKLLFQKAVKFWRTHGIMHTIKRIFTFTIDDLTLIKEDMHSKSKKLSLKEAYIKLRIHIKYFGLKPTLQKVMQKAYAKRR